MNLLNYIDISPLKPGIRSSESAHDKFNICKSALIAYNKIKPCNLENAILTDFLFGFGKFLAVEKEPKYSSSTIRDILRNTRPFLRSAISDGMVPNIDVVPNVLKALDKEVWPDASPDKKQPSYIIRLDLKVKESVNAIMRHLDNWSTQQRIDKRRKAIDRDQRYEDLQNRCVAIYLFCLLTYGISIKDALAIKRDWPGKELPNSVPVERYGMRLNLTPVAKKLIELYNKDSVCKEHLFFTLDNKKYNENPDNAAKLIEDHVVKYLTKHRIPLYKKKNLFVDWLNYAIECGAKEDEAEILWKHHIGNAPQCDPRVLFEIVQSTMNAQDYILNESWYLLCIIPLSAKRETFYDLLLCSGILGNEKESRKCIYAPKGAIKRGSSSSPIFNRYIFFRGTNSQAQYITGYSSNAYVLKDKLKNQFVRVSEEEIESLQTLLQDFPDAVELRTGDRWLLDHNTEIAKSHRAIIRNGGLAGKEVIAVDIKDGKNNKRTYILEYIDGMLKFHTDLTGIDLEINEK